MVTQYNYGFFRTRTLPMVGGTVCDVTLVVGSGSKVSEGGRLSS